MKCSVCGRELADGQMFCQCGNTVNAANGSYAYDMGDLNVNRPSSSRIMIIAAVSGFLVFSVIIAVIVSVFLNSANQMTDRSKWENISRSAYSITLPGNMKPSDVVEHDASNELTHLDTFRNGSVIVDVSVYYFTAEQKKYLKRQKIVELCKSALEEHGQTPLEHNELFYVEYQQDANNAFLGASQVWTYDAMYVSNDGFYEIAVFTPLNKREKNEEAIFAMLDSFRPKAN